MIRFPSIRRYGPLSSGAAGFRSGGTARSTTLSQFDNYKQDYAAVQPGAWKYGTDKCTLDQVDARVRQALRPAVGTDVRKVPRSGIAINCGIPTTSVATLDMWAE